MKSYADIMGEKRPEHQDDAFARKHPKMERMERAKIFAPFAALKWDEVAKRTEMVVQTEAENQS